MSPDENSHAISVEHSLDENQTLNVSQAVKDTCLGVENGLRLLSSSLDRQLGQAVDYWKRNGAASLCRQLTDWAGVASRSVRDVDQAARAVLARIEHASAQPAFQNHVEQLLADTRNCIAAFSVEGKLALGKVTSSAVDLIDKGRDQLVDPPPDAFEHALKATQEKLLAIGRDIELALSEKDRDGVGFVPPVPIGINTHPEVPQDLRDATAVRMIREHGAGEIRPGDLRQFVSDYDQAVNSNPIAWVPGSDIGWELARLAEGEEISGLKVDRREVLKELAAELAKEVIIHLILDGAGELLKGAGAAETAVEVSPFEIQVTRSEYEAIMGHTFPEHHFDELARLVDEIGKAAGKGALQNQEFVQAYADGDMLTAGRVFHNEAKKALSEIKTKRPELLPKAWQAEAEVTLRSGKGGSRPDLLFSKPYEGGAIFDWKTTGKSALSSKAIEQLDRHSLHLYERPEGLVPRRVESRSWTEYIQSALRDAWEAQRR